MATPRNSTYTAASGAAVVAGRPAWSVGLRQQRVMTAIANTDFSTRAKALVSNWSSYLGNDKIDGIFNDYSEVFYCAARNSIAIVGGGHQGSTINAVFEISLVDFVMALRGAPTPISAQPPIYRAGDGGGGPGPLQYPSGLVSKFFRATLTDPADTDYAAPQDTPQAAHTYASDIRGTKIYRFYPYYAEFDLATGQWSQVDAVDLGAQLNAISSNYTNQPLQQGTMAVYDPGTDQFLITMVPGDAGLNWRHGFFRFNPTTRTIVAGSVVQGDPYTRNLAIALTRLGDYAYGLTLTDAGEADVKGWRYQFSTNQTRWIQMTGDTYTFTQGGNAETVPARGAPLRGCIARWAYSSGAGALYEIDPTPLSGSGTSQADPILLRQRAATFTGALPASVKLRYRQPIEDPNSGMYIFLSLASDNIRVGKP